MKKKEQGQEQGQGQGQEQEQEQEAMKEGAQGKPTHKLKPLISSYARTHPLHHSSHSQVQSTPMKAKAKEKHTSTSRRARCARHCAESRRSWRQPGALLPAKPQEHHMHNRRETPPTANTSLSATDRSWPKQCHCTNDCQEEQEGRRGKDTNQRRGAEAFHCDL